MVPIPFWTAWNFSTSVCSFFWSSAILPINKLLWNGVYDWLTLTCLTIQRSWQKLLVRRPLKLFLIKEEFLKMSRRAISRIINVRYFKPFQKSQYSKFRLLLAICKWKNQLFFFCSARDMNRQTWYLTLWFSLLKFIAYCVFGLFIFNLFLGQFYLDTYLIFNVL